METSLILRKFNFRTDLEDIFRLMTDSREQSLFHGRMQINSLPEFERWMVANMAQFYHDFYVIFDESSYNIVGYVYSYEYRVYDGHCKVCIVLNKQYRDVGVGAICALRFLNELFTSYPLRKIFIDVYDYNKQSLQSNIDAGFVEEGCLKECRYYNGKYYDTHILGLTRERFYEKYGAIFPNE